MHLNEFQRLVDTVLVPDAAMSGDRIGTQIDSRRTDVRQVLVCFEVTDDVVAEATTLGCDAIVTFHPLIYAPLTSISRDERVGRLVCALIERDIALISVHTAFDAHPQGTNHMLASRLGLMPLRPLVPSAGVPGFGMGLIAATPSPLTMEELVRRVGDVCGSPVRFGAPVTESISTVAMVAGSGASFLDDAMAAGADVFITADVKYHAFHAAAGRIGIIDPGHFEMEQFVADGIVATLAPVMGQGVTLRASSASRNPVRYHSLQPDPSIS
jgi:dinuclear metal center YbgI/SA1388 family protein